MDDTDSAQRTATRMTWAATVIGTNGFGIYCCLMILAFYHIRYNNRSKKYQSQFLLWFILSFPFNLAYMSAASKWSELEFLEAKESPAAVANSLSFPLTITKDVIIVLQIIIAELFNGYRLWVSWGGDWRVMVPVGILVLADLAAGIILLCEATSPGAELSMHALQVRGTAFWSLSVALDVISAGLIAVKLWAYRQKALMTSLPREDMYSAAIAIFLESTGLYAISGILYMSFFAANHSLQYPLAAVFNATSTIAPTLVFVRMGMGNATDLRGQTDSSASGSAHLTTLPWTMGQFETQYETEYVNDEPRPIGAGGSDSFPNGGADIEMVDLEMKTTAV